MAQCSPQSLELSELFAIFETILVLPPDVIATPAREPVSDTRYGIPGWLCRPLPEIFNGVQFVAVVSNFLCVFGLVLLL